ncbi:MAG: type II toxin-antitoxin system RelE/ParE family toxin [Halobacteriovoraceae bacterium]|nr:type II toxin-antitoxin system RelE/ParE family toxin [Halobacteriovoraceae bacterium]
MKIREYLNKKGNSPFQKWYKGLDKSEQTKIDARLTRIKLMDNIGDYKPLKGGLFELRFIHRSGIRVYFTFEGKELIILFAGGKKGSQERDIEKARDYLSDYLQSGGNKNGQ